MKPDVSVIIAFYNNLPFLKLVLAGFQRQKFTSFEVVIADDGSNKAVVDQLESIKKEYSFPIQHVWHEDKGWRKNSILNLAIKRSSGHYLIFIDADCVPHGSFIVDHWNSKEQGSFLAGRRVHLSPRICEKIDLKNISNGYLENPLRYFADSIKNRPRTKNAEKSVRISNRSIRALLQKKGKKLLGCNMSMFKSDLVSINGFDERYINPGTGEDVDLNLRATNAGLEIKSLQWAGIQYHLWHKSNNPTKHPDNLKFLKENRDMKVGATPYSVFSKS